MAEPKLSVTEFSKRIKSKYPEYASYSDAEVVDMITSKYPEYKNRVDYGTKPKLSVSEFSKRIKAKYPEYSSYDDVELANMIVGKYPEFKDQVDLTGAGVKKKVSGEPSVGSESGTPSTLPPTLADTRPSVAPVRDQAAAVSNISQQQVAQKSEQKKANFEATGNIESQGETDYFTGEFGQFLTAMKSPFNPVGSAVADFVDDMGRAVSSGRTTARTVSPSWALIEKGRKTSDEDINKYIEVAKSAQKIKPSDEMQSFTEIAQKEGGIFGLLKGLAYNPTVIPEVMVSSIAGMINPNSLSSAGAIVGGATAAGAATGPGALATAAASLPFAMGAATATLEAGLTFSELLNEELEKRGMEFTKENVKTLLSDDNLISGIRMRALGRGMTIGVIDGMTGQLAGSVGAKAATTTAGKAGRVAAAGGIEMAGGSAGEAAGRAVAGQEMDIIEIGLEGIAEAPGTVIDIASVVGSRPRYVVNGENVSEANMREIVDKASPADLAGMDIKIKNDVNNYGGKIADAIETDAIAKEVKATVPNISDENVSRIVELEKELNQLSAATTQTAKDRVSEIKSEIKSLREQPVAVQPIVEPVTPQQDAVQEQATDEGVLRAEEPQVGLQEVGQGDQEPQVAAQEGQAQEVDEPLSEAEKQSQATQGEVDLFNEKVGRVKEDRDKASDTDTRRSLSENVRLAQREVATADDVDAAIVKLNNARKELEDFDASIEKVGDFDRVSSLVYDEVESSKKPDYEYTDLFNQDPRLAAIQNAKDVMAFLEEEGRDDESINRYKEKIKALESDIAKFPVKAQAKVGQVATPAQTAKAEKVAAEAEGEVEVYNQKIERLQEEIEIERGNLKEELDDINAKIKDVRASKLSAAEKKELIEDLKAQAQDVKNEINGDIGTYKEEIAALKSDIKKAQKKVEKARAIPAPKAKPVAAPVAVEPAAPAAPAATPAEPVKLTAKELLFLNDDNPRSSKTVFSSILNKILYSDKFKSDRSRLAFVRKYIDPGFTYSVENKSVPMSERLGYALSDGAFDINKDDYQAFEKAVANLGIDLDAVANDVAASLAEDGSLADYVDRVTAKKVAAQQAPTQTAEPAAEPATPAPTAAEEFERKKRELLLKSGIDPAILSRRRESADAPAGLDRLQSLADNALAAVARVMPKLKIVVHDNSFKFGKAVGASRIRNHGIYDPATKTIHINGPIASASTIAHEVFHAIFLEKVKTDATAQVAAKRMVDSIKNIVGEDTELYAYLEDFSNNYDDNFKDEEKLAELVGILADYYAGSDISGLPYEQSQSFKKAVIRFIRDIARAFNIKLPTNITDTDVLAVLDIIARKATEGKKISKSDIDVLSALAESSQEAVAATRERRGLITMTDKDALKFAKAGVQDMRVAQAATDIGLDKMKFDEASIQRKIKDELYSLDEDAQIGMYNGEPIVLTEDSPAVTGLILGEIKALEEQGAPLSQIEAAKNSIENKSFRNRYIAQYQKAQTETISKWLSELRPTGYSNAFKYLMLDAVLSHNYDFKLNKYFKRNSKTVRNITPFDSGTLAELYASTNSKELLIDYVKIQVKNMGNIVKANKFKSDSDGTWVKFNGGESQSSEDIEASASALSQLVQNTYWCTKTMAGSQLRGGDFYVYVSKSESGEFEPRIAIRMDGSRISEVRGNASEAQDIEPVMLDKAEKFLINDLPSSDGKKWVGSMRYNKEVDAFYTEMYGKNLTLDDYYEYSKLLSLQPSFGRDHAGNGRVEKLKNLFNSKIERGETDGLNIARNLGEIIPGVTNVLIGDKTSEYTSSSISSNGVDISSIKIIDGNLRIDSGDGWTDLKNIEIISRYLRVESPSLKTLGSLRSVGYIRFGESSSISSLGNLEIIGDNSLSFRKEVRVDSDPWFKNLTDFGKLKKLSTGTVHVKGTFQMPPLMTEINGPTEIDGDINQYSGNIESLGTVKVVNGTIDAGGSLKSLGNLEYVTSLNVTRESPLESLGKLKTCEKLFVSISSKLKSIDGIYVQKTLLVNGLPEVTLGNGKNEIEKLTAYSNYVTGVESVGELEINSSSREVLSTGSIRYVDELKIDNFRNSSVDITGLDTVGRLDIVTKGTVSANNLSVSRIDKFKSEDGYFNGLTSVEDIMTDDLKRAPDLKTAGKAILRFLSDTIADPRSSQENFDKLIDYYINSQIISEEVKQDVIPAAINALNEVIEEMNLAEQQNAPAIRERKATPVSMTAQESTEFDDLLRVKGGEKQTTIKPLAVREKKMTDQEIRANLDKRANKFFPSDEDVFTPDDFRVYFLDDNFKPIKGMENVSKMYQKIAENDGVYMLFGMGLRSGFMFTDQARGAEEVDIEFELDKVSPYTGTGSPDSVYISAIQVLSQEGQSKGAGTRLMNRIIEAADELGIPLELEAYPTKKFQRGERGEFSETTKQKMSKRLVEFYKKFGFTPIAKTGPDANMMIRQPQPLVRERKAGERKSLEQIKAENAAKREESRNKRMLERKELMEKARERFDAAAQKAKEEKEQAKQAEETLNNAIDEYVNAIINADNAKDINAKLKDLRKVAGTLNKTIFAKQMRKIAATLKKKGAISDVSVTTLNRILKTIERVGDENYQQEVERALNALKQEINAKLRRELNSMRKKALKNIQGGAIGTSALKPLFQKVLSIEAKMIPDSVFDDYNAIVRRLGASQSVLSLDDKEKFRAAMNDILDVIDAESRKLVELGELYRDYISSEKGAADMAYAVVADNMLSLGIINNEDRELMRRYKSIITAEAERAGYTAAEKGDMSEEAEIERLALIDEIKSIDVDVSTIDSRESRDAAKELLKNLNQVENMSNPELRKLVRVLQNMSSGFFPHEAQLMLKRLTAMRDSEVLSSAINEAKLLKTEAIVANIKGVVKRMLQYKYSETTPSLIAAERNPTPFIDNVFGNFKGKPIYNTLIRPLASAIASFQRDYDVAVNDMSTAEKRLVDSFMRNGNAVRSSKYKIQMYLLQREYNSNQGNPEVIPASKWIKSTLAAIDDTTLYNPATGAELRELLTKYSRDGEVSTELIEKSLTPAEKNFIATIDKINNSLRDKALHVSDVIRGEGIQARDNYVHINVMYMGKDAVRSEVKDIINRYTASTKSKSLITRAGSAAPINLDPYTSVLRGARMTLLDYHMTPALQQTNSTLAMTDKKVTGNARQTLTAIKEMMKGLTDNILTNSVGSSSSIEQYITRAGYRAVLSSIPSRSAEFISNLGMAFAAPTDYLSGSKIYSKIGNDLSIGDFMKNAGSTQVNRVSDGETLTNKQIESNPFRNLAGASVAIQNDVANVMSIIGRAMKRHTVDVSSKIADEIISFSDKHVAKRVWIGKFDSKFKELTGSSPDLKKIADNDEAYMDKYGESIKEATKTADDMVIIVAASTNPYDAIMKLQDKPDAGTLKKIASSINTFMSRFQIYDFNIARAAVNEMMGNGSMSREYGARILAGVALRTMLYTLAADYLAGLFSVTVRSLMAELGLIDDLDEDEFLDALMPDEDTPYATIRAFGGSIANLVINRNFGNMVKNLFSFGIETVNKEHMDALRNGEAYDPYENNILVSQIPTELNRGQTAGEALIGAFSGPLGPINKATMRGIKVADRAVTGKSPRTRVDAMQELQTRTPIELAGSLGVIPLYKDVRNVMLDIMYKKYDKKKKPKK